MYHSKRIFFIITKLLQSCDIRKNAYADFYLSEKKQQLETSSKLSTFYLLSLQPSLTPATKQHHCSIWDHQGTAAPPYPARGVDLRKWTNYGRSAQRGSANEALKEARFPMRNRASIMRRGVLLGNRQFVDFLIRSEHIYCCAPTGCKWKVCFNFSFTTPKD